MSSESIGHKFQFQMVQLKAKVVVPALESVGSFNSKWFN